MLKRIIAEQPFVLISSILVFAFFALTFVTSSGYGYPAAFMMFAGLFTALFHRDVFKIPRELIFLVLTFLMFAALWHLEVYWHDQATREHDKPFRFIAAAIALIFMIRFPPKENYFWFGIAVAAISAGVIAFYERFYVHVSRANGHTNAIQFGNLAMLFGLLCLVGIKWAIDRSAYRRIWLIGLLLGFVMGLLASLLSGSRGGWIGLPLILLFISKQYWGLISRRAITGIMASALLIVISLYMVPSTGIQKRVESVFSDLREYKAGNPLTSVGTRVELWRGSLMIISDYPIWGLGRFGYEDKLIEMRDSGIINPDIISHSHNDILDAGVRRGLIGILSLIALYCVPLIIFKRHLNHSESDHLAMAGLVVVLAYIDFGLTQVFFAHNNGVMIYSFAIIFLVSIIHGKRYCNRERT